MEGSYIITYCYCTSSDMYLHGDTKPDSNLLNDCDHLRQGSASTDNLHLLTMCILLTLNFVHLSSIVQSMGNRVYTCNMHVKPCWVQPDQPTEN